MLRSLFGLALIAAGFTSALFSRHLALLTYVWLALFRPMQWVWWDLSALRISLVSGLLLVVPSLASGQWPNLTHPLNLAALFFGLTVLGAQVTSYVAPDWTMVDQFFRLLFVCLLAVTLLNSRRRLIEYIAMMAGSIAFFSAKAGVVAALAGGVQFADGQAGAFRDSNGYALAIDMAIPLMAAAATLLRFDRPWDRFIRPGFFAAIPLSVFTIIGTMSRGGLLALGALAFVYAGMQRRWALWMTSVALAGTLIYFFAPMPQGYLDRVETIATYNEVGEGSALSRLHFWRVATVIAVANPMGIGLGKFESVYDDYAPLYGTFGTARAVHSSHFQVLAEMGFLGALGWTALFVYALYLCVKVRVAAPRVPGLSADVRHYYTTVSVALAASMIAFIVGGAFIAAATNDLTWFVFAAVAAMDRLFAREARAARPVVQEAIARVAPVRPRRAAIA